jgi:hypothetical protein
MPEPTEIEAFADLTLRKWVDHGPSPQTSWLDIRPWAIRAGLTWQSLAEVLENLAERKPGLVRKTKRVMEDILTRRHERLRPIVQLRLDALPRVLLRINLEKLEYPKPGQFIEALQDDFYEVLVQKMFRTGTGDDAMQRARARLGEFTGINLPLFESTPKAEPIASVDAEVVELMRAAPDEATSAREADRAVEELKRSAEIDSRDLMHMISDEIQRQREPIMHALQELGFTVDQFSLDAESVRNGHQRVETSLARIFAFAERFERRQDILLLVLQLGTATDAAREELGRKLRRLTMRPKAPRFGDDRQLGLAW